MYIQDFITHHSACLYLCILYCFVHNLNCTMKTLGICKGYSLLCSTSFPAECAVNEIPHRNEEWLPTRFVESNNPKNKHESINVLIACLKRHDILECCTCPLITCQMATINFQVLSSFSKFTRISRN